MKKILLIFIILLMLIMGACQNKMPKDFDFTFSIGIENLIAKEVINTFEDYYIKDLVLDGTIKTELILTEEEMKRIYDQMIAIDIMSYSSVYEPYSTELWTPYLKYTFYIQINGEKKDIYWNDSGYSNEDDAIALRNLIQDILKIVYEKDEYIVLPSSKGGYM